MRLFIALNLPESVRTSLRTVVRPLEALGFAFRWMTQDQIHLTVKFLGDVEPEREPELRAALGRAAAGVKTITLGLGGFGVFPHAHRPRVLWVGVTPEPAMELLHHGVEREFAPLGFPTEARTYRPHVTLARAAPGAKPGGFAKLEGALANLQFESAVVVETVDLMESTLQSAGAVYQVRHRERLS